MPTPATSQLLIQLKRLRDTGFADKLEQHATDHNFPTPFFFAIASRETNCQNILGDKQNGVFHGVGIVQIDIQHPIAKTARDNGTWKTNPDPLIEFGALLYYPDVEGLLCTPSDVLPPDVPQKLANSFRVLRRWLGNLVVDLWSSHAQESHKADELISHDHPRQRHAAGRTLSES